MTRRLGATLATFTAASLLARSPRVAWADPPAPAPPTSAARRTEAEALAKEGAARYGEGRYAEAQVALERARELDPRPAHLYALGQIARRLNDCRRAIRHYRAFIIESSSQKEIEAARVQIDRCEEVLAAEAPAPASQHVVTTPPPPAFVVPPARPPGVDGLAVGLVVTGGVALAVGGVFLWRATRPAGGETYGEFEASRPDRERDRLIAAGLGVGGLALTSIAVVRWLRAPTASTTTTATVAPGGDGAALVVVGSF